MWSVPSTAEVADQVIRIGPDTVPDEVVARAKLCFADWIGVAIGGSRQPLASIVQDVLAASGPQAGRATIIGTGTKTGELLAALANGAQGHALDFDDTHLPSVVHVSSPVLPAVLAAAEARRATGRQVLDAYVAGVEVAARIGRAVGEELADRGFHVTGVLGHLAAAAAAAHVLRLDRARLENSLGIAATQAAGLVASFGTMSKPLHAGKAAMDGLLAALLAERGFTGPGSAIEGPAGLLSSLLRREMRASVGSEIPLGSAVLEISLKPYASCFGTHAAIDAAQAIRRLGKVPPERIARVECLVHPLAAKVAGNARPVTGLEGKFSIQYCVALALAGSFAGEADFTDDAVGRPALQRLLARVVIMPDPSVPATRATVRVLLADGGVLEQETLAPSGTPQRPMSAQQLRDKFTGLAAPVIGDERARELLDACARLDELPGVGQLVALAGARSVGAERPRAVDR